MEKKSRSAALQRAILRRKQRGKKRGIALIMVLGAITILTVFLTELQTDTSAALAGALADRDRLKAEYYARSAVNLSRMLLSSEKLIRTDPSIAILLSMVKIKQIPVWEFSSLVLGAFNGGDRARVFGSNVGVDLASGKNIGIPGRDYFEATIIDEDSKVNINTSAGANPPAQLMLQLATMFAQPQYAPMFEGRDADEQFSDPGTLCAAIVDWADADENLTNCAEPKKPPAGAEDNIYQMLGLDYRRKNAAYDSLDELRLIRGMDDDRWATFVDPDPNDPHKRLVTVWGQDISNNPININTANAQTLWAIVCSVAAPQTPICTDPLQAAAFLQVFTLIRTFARGVPLFMGWSDFKKAMQGQGMVGGFLASLGVPPVTFNPDIPNSQLKKIFKTESKVFSIYTEGVVPGQQREARVRVHAVVDMREALDWSKVASPLATGAALNSTAPLPSSTAEPAATPPGGINPDLVDEDFVKELKTNPFGTVIYYRVD
jgi:general secretion pathway protein K